MHSERFRNAAALLTLACLVVWPAALAAQRLPGFGGIEARLGGGSPQQANTGLSMALDVDLGYMGTPRVRGLVGFDYFRAGIDRRVAGSPVGGNYSATGGMIGARLDMQLDRRSIPYVVAGLHGYSVDARTQSQAVSDLLGGFTVGVGIGAGLAFALADDSRSLAVGQVRRVFANNINHWNIQVGFRHMPRGRGSYTVVPRRPRALDQMNAEGEIIREEQIRIAGERRVPERELREVGIRAGDARALERARRLHASLLDLERELVNITDIHDDERGLVIVLGQGLFPGDRNTLAPRERADVARLAAVLAAYPETHIVVEGHTDARGAELANLRLSEQRADAVRAAMIAEGIEPERVESVGYGAVHPVADNDTADGRARNRRVEVVVVGMRWPVGAR